MEKLELKHLAPYLPYQLECYGASEIWHLEGLSHRKIWIKNSRGFQTMDYGDFEADYSILLHPLSDLTKQIDCPEFMGEKFVPIVELAKIADIDTSDEDYHAVSFNDIHAVKFNIENDDDDYTHVCFAYDSYNNFGVHKRRSTEDHNGDIFHVPHQFELWSKCFEWHFDVFGLIEKGLAIDINTL